MDIGKLAFATLLLASAALLGACEEQQEAYVATSRPVKTIVVGGGSNGDVRTFPAEVDAIQKADISFRVSGRIQKIYVKEGDQVKKGQLLAELDPTDFEITLKDREASYKTAKANYDRAKELVEKDAISRVEHDNIRAQYHTAQANLNSAKQDLVYTKLKADFDGYIAKRYVENFEEVLRSEKIFSLQDVSSLKMIIDVPENLMITIDKSSTGQRELYATFDNIKNKRFPLKFREASTKADPSTKTFEVTLTMDSSQDYTGSAPTVTLPVSAVISDNRKQATVWIVDEDTMTVHPKKVVPGLMTGDSIQVDGLSPGDRIVTAGASFLRENMKVTLLQTGEQPEQ